ncbi:MAG: hypothetical protein JO356_06395 [Acidobacteria bacterium]|nr:hypothetical protein [Acidobacteriota bacterium]
MGSILALLLLAAVVFVFQRRVDVVSVPDSPIEQVLRELNQHATDRAQTQVVDFDAADSDNTQHKAPSKTRRTGPLSQSESVSFGNQQLPAPDPGQRTWKAIVYTTTRQPTAPTKTPNKTASIPLAQPQLENATAAMIRLFRTHDVIMFGEVHDSKQEYEWLCSLVQTPAFGDHVNDIVVEFGNARYQGLVDRYTKGEDVRFSEVQHAWRNIAGVEPVSPVYGWLYHAVRRANLMRKTKRRIRLLMGSPPLEWNRMTNSTDVAQYDAQRERWYTQVVKREVIAQHHHALLIMGAEHFLRSHGLAQLYEIASTSAGRTHPPDQISLGPGSIEQELLKAGANPYLVVFGTNAVDGLGDTDQRITLWPTPVIASLRDNWVGALSGQPIISGGHMSPTPLTLGEQADALLYVAPCSALTLVRASRAQVNAGEFPHRGVGQLGQRPISSYDELPQCIPLASVKH